MLFLCKGVHFAMHFCKKRIQPASAPISGPTVCIRVRISDEGSHHTQASIIIDHLAQVSQPASQTPFAASCRFGSPVNGNGGFQRLYSSDVYDPIHFTFQAPNRQVSNPLGPRRPPNCTGAPASSASPFSARRYASACVFLTMGSHIRLPTRSERLAGWLACWLACWPTGWLAGRLAGCLAGGLADPRALVRHNGTML